MNSLVKTRDGIRDAAHLTTSRPSSSQKKKKKGKKKCFRSFVRGDTIFVISNNRMREREMEADCSIHMVKILRAHHVARSLMTADISQTSRTTKYANVTTTSNDRRTALPLEFGGQKLKHESMNATNAQNPNKCPSRGCRHFFLFSKYRGRSGLFHSLLLFFFLNL